MAIMRFGAACARVAPNDSSRGKQRVTPVARRKVRREVFMTLLVKEQRTLNNFVNECTNTKLRRATLLKNGGDFVAIRKANGCAGRINEELFGQVARNGLFVSEQ